MFTKTTSRNPGAIPYLLDVQHDLHRNLTTRTVVPLVTSYSANDEIKKLCPVLNVMGTKVIMSTPEMAGYPVSELGLKVTSAANQRTEIINAIDFKSLNNVLPL